MDEKNKENNDIDTRMIHFSLSFSYTTFLFAVILGVIFDMIFPLQMLVEEYYKYIGVILIFIGSVLAYWAQTTSRRSKNYEVKERNVSDFLRGPYKYIRTPTHFGIFVMTLGLALAISSPFSIIFTIIAHAISKLIFIRKEESLLEKKYGQVFVDYKKKVKNWI